MNKTVYVKAHFKAVGKTVNVKVATGETTRGFFGGEKAVYENRKEWQQTGWSDSEVDGKRLSADIAVAISTLNQEGYEVTAMSPVISGNYHYQYSDRGITSSQRIFGDTEKVTGGGSYGFGYGYSYSEGVTLIARKVT